MAGTHCPCRSHRSSRMAWGSPQKRYHRPSRVMPTGTASYFSSGSASKTAAADWRETLYSGEQPPKKTAIVVLLIFNILSLFGPKDRP